MRKRVISLFIAVVMVYTIMVAGATVADAETTYTETVDVYIYAVGGMNPDPVWTHTYDGSASPEGSVTLTIVADDVDLREQDEVFINGYSLGYLKDLGKYTNWSYYPGPGNPAQGTTTTTFNVPRSCLDLSIPMTVAVDTMWGVEIETSTLTVESGDELEVSIDIKPWSDPNSINTKIKNDKNGVIPVALLGSTDLDVEAIDFEELELYFGPEKGLDGATPSHDNKAEFAGHIVYQHLRDPDGTPNNGDEYMATANDDLVPDLVVHFKIKETDFAPGDTVGYLWGIINGISISGSDTVNIVK